MGPTVLYLVIFLFLIQVKTVLFAPQSQRIYLQSEPINQTAPKSRSIDTATAQQISSHILLEDYQNITKILKEMTVHTKMYIKIIKEDIKKRSGLAIITKSTQFFKQITMLGLKALHLYFMHQMAMPFRIAKDIGTYVVNRLFRRVETKER